MNDRNQYWTPSCGSDYCQGFESEINKIKGLNYKVKSKISRLFASQRPLFASSHFPVSRDTKQQKNILCSSNLNITISHLIMSGTFRCTRYKQKKRELQPISRGKRKRDEKEDRMVCRD